MANWIAVFLSIFCGVTVFSQSTLLNASYKPVPEAVARKHADKFKSIRLVKTDDAFGGWTHFADGGTFDQIYGR